MGATGSVAEGEQPIDRLAYGLRGDINRFPHDVINVSDLDRAAAFS